MSSEQVQWIEVSRLQPHPKNPRLSLRQDVVDAIAAQVSDGGFHPSHAIIARPVNGHIEILAGHHRHAGAVKAGVDKVPCWVRELDDDSAYMLLATSNAQGELSPLEIGMHAADCVEPGKRGRGNKGDGLKGYAEKIGKSFQYVSQLVKAAKVAKCSSQLEHLGDKTQHLVALHKLPEACWPSACEWLASADVPVSDVERRVAQAVEYGHQNGVTAEWADYLPTHRCQSAIVAGTNPNTFNKLLALAAKVAADLTDGADLTDAQVADLKKLVANWRGWLVDNAGGESWDMRAVQSKRVELENAAWEIKNKREEKKVVSLILADPPWQYDFAETDSRQIENQYPSATVEEICTHIDAPWAPEVADDCVLFLWATAPKLQEALQVMVSWGFTYKTHAVWDKEKIGMGYWFRGQHELLLVGTKGDVSPPEQERRVSSVFREARGKHSAKPECVYAALEKMFPDVTRAEFYQRTVRDGWVGVGNEAKGDK